MIRAGLVAVALCSVACGAPPFADDIRGGPGCDFLQQEFKFNGSITDRTVTVIAEGPNNWKSASVSNVVGATLVLVAPYHADMGMNTFLTDVAITLELPSDVVPDGGTVNTHGSFTLHGTISSGSSPCDFTLMPVFGVTGHTVDVHL